MSLTKAALLDKIKPRELLVEIETYGKIRVRSVPNLVASKRRQSYRDQETGELIADEIAKAEIHTIIDQVYTESGEPMFSDSDFDALAAADDAATLPLYEAIRAFNDGEQKKTSTAP